MPLPYRRLLACLALLSLLGQGCTKAPSADVVAASKRTEIVIWAVIDDQDAYAAVLQAYQKLHPNVTFTYRRLRLEEYESDLLNALAEDRGPDIFMIHNDQVGKYLSKIMPMPPTTHVAYSLVTGTVSKSQTWEVRDDPAISLRQFKDQYADVVTRDLLRTVNVSKTDTASYQERAMAVPVGVDTLALYYNKDLLNAAGIPNPPETWDEFQTQVKKLTKIDPSGNLQQAGAAIGTSANVERSSDILSVLMMQNGAQMQAEDGSVTFQLIPTELQGIRDTPPAYQALQFYTDFANPSKDVYTWNAAMPNSLDAFITGQAAYFLGYSYHLPQIRARAPKLNFGISALPQIAGNPVRNFANYWVWSVSKKSKNQEYAWSFLNYLTDPAQVTTIINAGKRPAAVKSLLTGQLNDEDVGVFASQVLTASSWYRGNDPQAVETAFAEMVDNVVAGRAPIKDAVNFASDRVSQTVF